MSKLNIDQKSIRTLFSEKKADFLIPDYQRPYAWEEKECQTLWDDLFLFAFPDNDCDKFNSESDEYFLGPIVTFKNEEGKMEIIDGQQRLTTLMLLLRAFYEKYGSMKNDKAVKTSKFIEQCIWKTDEFGDPNKSALKIDSEVATDKEKDEFLHILKTGTVTDIEKSNYANNYRFFQKKIVEFLNAYPDWFSFFPIRIMNNCILLPIEAESQDEKFLSNIIRLIEDHLSESELNVNALCELSGISNKQIYRKIKQLTGMSPVEYIKSIRMKKAAMLLQQKKFTVAEVMYMVGFSNHSYFSKCFQAEFGKTPRQYLNEDL